MIKINYRLVLLLIVFLTILMMQIGHADNPPPIPPPLPKISGKEQKTIMKKIKNNPFYKISKKPMLPDFSKIEKSKISINNVDMASRYGHKFKINYTIDNLTTTARSIYPKMIDYVPNFEFKEKEFYKAYFSIAIDFGAVNHMLAKKLGKNGFPKLKKGTVVYIELFNPKNNKLIYSAWGKLNTDIKKDFVQSNKKYKYSSNKICLAVASSKEIAFFQGKKAKIYVYITNPPSSDFIKKQMQNQGVVERPAKTINF